MPPAARNVRDTEPLFWEGVQSHRDFDLETNEFVPPEDFGCSPLETEDHPESCVAREEFLLERVGLTFEEIGTDVLGEFLIGRPRLMPNPQAQTPSRDSVEAIKRGRALFDGAAQCASCHPAGTTTGIDPFTNNQNLAAVISPSPLDNGLQFKDEVDGNFNVPSLRGVWDRPRVYLHDGRAKSLRSAILGSGHPALSSFADGCHILAEGSEAFVNGIVQPVTNGRGCNEVKGQQDTHGATSTLSPEQVADLEAFVLAIE
jgi:hypothetical protein